MLQARNCCGKAEKSVLVSGALLNLEEDFIVTWLRGITDLRFTHIVKKPSLTYGHVHFETAADACRFFHAMSGRNYIGPNNEGFVKFTPAKHFGEGRKVDYPKVEEFSHALPSSLTAPVMVNTGGTISIEVPGDAPSGDVFTGGTITTNIHDDIPSGDVSHDPPNLVPSGESHATLSSSVDGMIVGSHRKQNAPGSSYAGSESEYEGRPYKRCRSDAGTDLEPPCKLLAPINMEYGVDENSRAFVVTIPTPGVKDMNELVIVVDDDDRSLSIRGCLKYAVHGKRVAGLFRLKSGQFEVSFKLPSKILSFADDIEVVNADGVTTITLKKEVQSTQKVHIVSSLDGNRLEK
ncbi:hypothetical protein BC936DRAFT_137300 [Jimgerdemannia flammicorona]|uniref:SHSP domain-containing protein n=1 Tax=Jimgerdemannia flammicorona TaxID=994334 RepID=A0A433CXR2_9FUNG|nr:hypothetical protein BC936DRAFT_137300 [Jimgerdemannia flammicorona]